MKIFKIFPRVRSKVSEFLLDTFIVRGQDWEAAATAAETHIKTHLAPQDCTYIGFRMDLMAPPSVHSSILVPSGHLWKDYHY